MIEKKKENTLKKLTSALPLVTLIVLVYGATKQFTYYFFFNFNVFPFIEITELLPQTLFDFIISLFYLSLSVFSAIIYRKLIKRLILEDVPVVGFVGFQFKKETFNNAAHLPRSNRELLRLKIYIFLLCLILLFVIFSEFNSIIAKPSTIELILIIREKLNLIFLNLFIYLFSLILSIVVILYSREKTFNKNFVSIYPIIILFILNAFMTGYFNYNKVRRFHTHNNCSITLSNKIIISSNNFYYIGNTKSDVFFYDVKERLVTVYPMSLVNQMKIGSD